MNTYSVSIKAYKALLYKLFLMSAMFLFLGGIFMYLAPFLLLKFVLFLSVVVSCLFVFINIYKQLKKVYLAHKQYIKIDEDSITMVVYDVVQNKAVTYAREEPIYQGLNILHISSIRETPFAYYITGDFEETILRRNPFTVKKFNETYMVYKVFENNKDIKRILKGIKGVKR